MIRTLILIAVVAATALFGAPHASAAELTPMPCPPRAHAAIRAALPTSAAPVCRGYKTEPQTVDGQTTTGKLVELKADVLLTGGRKAMVDLTPEGDVKSIIYQHSDIVGSSGKGMALLFWAFALATVGGALFVITRRNLIAAVMGMVGSFLGISAIYMMLYAQFLAVIQMLVYAGAIMVLFVFVVMILNRPEDEPVAPSGRLGQVLGGAAILYLIGRLIMLLIKVEPPNPALAAAAPRITAQGHEWGSVRAVGTDLFGPGLFPFEAVSILLLVAVVGAIAIARPLHEEEDQPAKTRAEGGVP